MDFQGQPQIESVVSSIKEAMKGAPMPMPPSSGGPSGRSGRRPVLKAAEGAKAAHLGVAGDPSASKPVLRSPPVPSGTGATPATPRPPGAHPGAAGATRSRIVPATPRGPSATKGGVPASPRGTPTTPVSLASTPAAVTRVMQSSPQAPSPQLSPGTEKCMEISLDAEGEQTSIVTEGHPCTEIRTKVFRMGAPLLRSTIPIQLGTRRPSMVESMGGKDREMRRDSGSDAGSDAEMVLADDDDIGVEDLGTFSVTFDFPV